MRRKPSGTARVRALSARLKALEGYCRLLERAGRIPDQPRQWIVEQDIDRAVDVIVDVFQRYDVPVEAQREIRDLLDGRGRRLEAG
jgi:hypothetical protein